ncbi:MAG TPA: response regulator transcription factor [Puia sp.]|nr:response regulator transcription factor [Puia sp.]
MDKPEQAKKIILIVDDSVIIIDRLIAFLESLASEHLVLTCNTYQQALQAINEKDPDVAVLDINLPDGNGIGLLRYIKKHKPAVAVIMFTNQSTDFYRQLCLREGAAFFIDKSSGFDGLSESIGSLLRQSSK